MVAGDEAAWTMIVNRYSESLWRLTASYRLDSATRHDVIQTVWLRLYDRASTINDPNRMIGWIAVAVRNECINVIRRRARVVDVDPTDHQELAVDLPDMTAHLERELATDAISAAFARLDDRCRDLLTLGLVEPPIPYEEIAGMLDMPKGSIGPTRRRCLDKMRAMSPIAALDPKGMTS